jgi:hypothetical protein
MLIYRQYSTAERQFWTNEKQSVAFCLLCETACSVKNLSDICLCFLQGWTKPDIAGRAFSRFPAKIQNGCNLLLNVSIA